jgi:hypothetical protein
MTIAENGADTGAAEVDMYTKTNRACTLRLVKPISKEVTIEFHSIVDHLEMPDVFLSDLESLDASK